jgi:hypothetical protein
MVMEETAFTTVAVYAVVPDTKEGLKVPELSTNESKFASVFTDAARVITTVYSVVNFVADVTIILTDFAVPVGNVTVALFP